MLNKKGFTLVELLAVVAILGILSGFAVMAVTSYKERSRQKLYQNYEKQMKDATVNYFTSHLEEIPDAGNNKDINIDDLIEASLLDSMTDPLNSNLKCSGYINVKNNSNITGSSSYDASSGYDSNGNITTSNTSNLDLTYKVCLRCQQYHSKVNGCS